MMALWLVPFSWLRRCFPLVPACPLCPSCVGSVAVRPGIGVGVVFESQAREDVALRENVSV